MENFIKSLENPFCYYVYLVDREGKMEHLHFGLWEEDTRDIKEAQENLAVLIKSLIPDGVKDILDVGCGLGRTTYELSTLKYNVIGISPDKNLIEMAEEKYIGHDLQFVTVSLENYKPEGCFDLVLFQESSQYVVLKSMFKRCKKMLKKDGYILICDEVKYTNNTKEECHFHNKEKMLAAARKAGFKMLHNKDITDKILHTSDFVIQKLTEEYEDIIKYFSHTRENARSEIDTLIEGWKIYNKMYKEHLVGYEVFLFKKEGSFLSKLW